MTAAVATFIATTDAIDDKQYAIAVATFIATQVAPNRVPVVASQFAAGIVGRRIASGQSRLVLS